MIKMKPILKVFTCQYCKKHFVIVKANKTLIPVNCKKGDIFEPMTYVSNEMRSHLKDCKGRRETWQKDLKLFLLFPERTILFIPDTAVESSTISTDEAGEDDKPKGTLIPGTPGYEQARKEFEESLKRGQ